MKLKFLCTCITLLLFFNTKAQLYFPPTSGNTWDTMSINRLGWCDERVDSLYEFLDANNTKAFILLKDGKIVLEKYFNAHSATSNWYWASAGKSLSAFMVGLAQEDKYLSINDTSSKYLKKGWTNCSPSQEDKITIKHQLSMTTGLDDGVPNSDCTADSCLIYLADPGKRWAYHNAPYTLLDGVIEGSTGKSLSNYVKEKLHNQIGMDGQFVRLTDNNVYFSTARSMARFGLLALNKGVWDGNTIMSDTAYFHDMINTSQNLNKSYGYLWWLNGKESFMAPGLQTVFKGSMLPDAPKDLYAALGKNGQFINVVPSENLVFVRMGEAPSNNLVPIFMNNDIWKYINKFKCEPVGTKDIGANSKILVYPVPASNVLHVKGIEDDNFSYKITDISGKIVQNGMASSSISITELSEGIYFLSVHSSGRIQKLRFVKH